MVFGLARPERAALVCGFHVRVAWVLVRRHGARAAEERVVEGTREGCDHYGVPDEFDEQLTRDWARAVSDAASDSPAGETFDDFMGRNPALERGDLLNRDRRR
jgi:hypothetical protein